MSKKYTRKTHDRPNSKEQSIKESQLDPSDTSDSTLSKLSKDTQETLIRLGYQSLFRIQVSCYDPIYSGRNLIGQEKTGMGKTLAFLLPVMERIRNQQGLSSGSLRPTPKVLILSPTKELANQIGE